MTCTHCGTEIAEKALICYRCGRSTVEPTKPGLSGERERRSRRPMWPAALGLVVLLLAGLFMATPVVGRVPDWLRWTIAGCAAILLAWRIVRRVRR